MKSFLLILVFIVVPSAPTPVQQDTQGKRRQEQNVDSAHYFDIVPEDSGVCIRVTSEEGLYRFVSDGSASICGLYIIADPEHVLEIEVETLDISCSGGGLLAIIDGWELNGQFFPGEDHPKPLSDRFVEICGHSTSWKPFRTELNVALIQFLVPTLGEGFSVSVRFLQNFQPCNAVIQWPKGIYTLRNNGRAINCSVAFITKPERFRLLAAEVGGTGMGRPSVNLETGVIYKCKERGFTDYVEVKGGGGIDPDNMLEAVNVCGTFSVPSKTPIDVLCNSSVIRLVSSGRYKNSVTVSFEMLTEENLTTGKFSLVCEIV
ncbi:corticotropin-releasing factor-binding protein-like [Limulus polyphemus]|uniref:Corticotropin-releasing factor-binding protein-like n=1 Tax=Limulus polyphemus TaxID=6850 RepID=A0ABM1SWJ1_LIMPO|nr:corticotropin-releasing factor-binding protein-like [Limulus polyphemus]